MTKMNKTFTVNGMKCMHCKAKVEAALQALDGVQKANADLQNKNVTIDYDEKTVSVDDLKKAVGASGKYQLVG
jgi:copper chaperone